MLTDAIRQRLSNMESDERVLCLGIGDNPRLFSERQKHQDNADALAAVLSELDRLTIIEEAFDLSMQRADRIMKLAPHDRHGSGRDLLLGKRHPA